MSGSWDDLPGQKQLQNGARLSLQVRLYAMDGQAALSGPPQVICSPEDCETLPDIKH